MIGKGWGGSKAKLTTKDPKAMGASKSTAALVISVKMPLSEVNGEVFVPDSRPQARYPCYHLFRSLG